MLQLLISNAVTSRRDKSILYSRIAISISICCFLVCLNSFYLKINENGLGIFSGLFQTTPITHIFHIFVFLITALILQLNGFYPRKVWTEHYSSFVKLLFYKFKYFNSFILNKMAEQYRIIEYPLIILFVLLGGVFLISSSNYISIFLALELQSYGLYILCVVYRNSERATSGALTYFLLGGLSSCFILLAFGLLYANSGNTSLDGLYVTNNIYEFSNNLKNTGIGYFTYLYESNYLNYALVVMSIGFLFKISAAPFHFWSPDVYDAIPTVVTTFVAVFAKISILVLLLEIVHYTSGFITSSLEAVKQTDGLFFNFSWTFTLLLSSFLSLIIGSVLGLTQFRIKRLYAYSTISHIGFILLALSVNSIESIQSFIFYLMQYSITNVNAFILLTAIAYSLYLYVEKKDSTQNDEKQPLIKKILDKNNSPLQLISQMKGYYYINPLLALSLAITLFSFVGIPPLVGFFAKQMVLSSALDNGYVFMVLIAILTSVISAYYYLALVQQIFFNKTDYILNPALENTQINASIISNISPNTRKDILVYVNNIHLSSFITTTISVLTLIILLFIFIPQEWLSMATILALTIFNN